MPPVPRLHHPRSGGVPSSLKHRHQTHGRHTLNDGTLQTRRLFSSWPALGSGLVDLLETKQVNAVDLSPSLPRAIAAAVSPEGFCYSVLHER